MILSHEVLIKFLQFAVLNREFMPVHPEVNNQIILNMDLVISEIHN